MYLFIKFVIHEVLCCWLNGPLYIVMHAFWLASFLYQLTNTVNGKPCHNILFIFKHMYTHVKHFLDVYHFSKR